ncbi:MAG: thiol:disulfide interchange protein [Verrucomicrobiaceae bacterium]|nr:thiol:disulfide interchange protein [Verrucomicrobiaceae bacterium]
MKHWAILCLSLLCFSLTARAASDRAATEQVSAQLLSSVTAVHPGEKIWLGVQQKIIPHWHTYWINPGDSGLPTKISWQLPTGAKASNIQWPNPTRFNLGTITNYGYSDEVTLLTSVDIPATVKPGENFSIAAQVDWLVCEEICIPQKVDLALTLPIAAASSAASSDSHNVAIERALAQLPQPSLWPVRTERRDNHLTLRISGAEKQLSRAEDITFFANEWGRVEHTAEQPHRIDNDDVIVELTAGEKKLADNESLSGVLVISENTGDQKTRTGFIVGAAPSTAGTAAELSSAASAFELLSAALFALLGGIVLNLMPCVFPVLSIKALSLLKHSNHSPAQNRLHGLSYTGGVLASFVFLAVLLIVLKAGGTQIGWGFQYQSPVFVLLVAYLMFAVGLSLSGVFEFGTSVTGVGSALAEKSGYAGSFFTGVLAAIVATPCTAPFMGAAIGYALAKPPLQLITVFLSLGFGLALPYLLLTLWPPLQRRLPRPGQWMEWLKQALAFPMYAAAVWLVWVLAQQAGPNAIVFALGGMVVIAFSAWIYQNTRAAKTAVQRFGAAIALVAIVLAISGGYSGVANTSTLQTESVSSADKNWESYSAQRLKSLRESGKPIFINFTAAWCISCLVNDRVALSQRSVIDGFSQHGVTYLKGDWTNQDREISTKLAEFGRSGVPLYIYFPQGIGSEPIVLPQILTPEIVLSAIASAPATTAAVTFLQKP